MARSRVTLLQRLMEERHLSHADTIKLLERRARQMGAADFSLGERTLDHWLSGTLRTAPQPVRRRVLEAEFGHAVTELLSFAEDGPRLPSPRAAVDPGAVSAAAARSARFGQRLDGNAISELTLEQLRLRLAQLSAGYVHAPIWPVFMELAALRDDVLDLLETPDPARAADLYVIAGTTCAMLAHASGNLGFLDEAAVHAHTALICGRRVGHRHLTAWALGVRALQAEWHGRPNEALEHLARIGPEVPYGWLAAIEARAQASRGRAGEALAALERVERTRPNGSLDAIGGIFAFPEPKRLFYSASALRRLGRLPDAESTALAAIREYESGPRDQRSYGDEALAWLEVAIARAGRAELDGAAEAVERVGDLPPERLVVPLLRPLDDLRTSVSAVRLRSAAPTTRILRAVDALTTSTRRQVTDAGA